MIGSHDVAIRARALVKRYGSFPALHGIDLDVGRGEVFGFIGPNGAGKTTLIRTMLDLIRPSEGEILVFGLDSRRDARENVPGELGLWEKLTARQVCSHLAGLRGGDGADRIEALADRLRLTLDRPIRELSKGNKEKVGLIQAFMHEPDLLVLDEPTGGLDPLIQHEVFTMIDETKGRGATVFFSSHYLSEVERIADRVGIVREGRMATTDTVAGLKRRAPRRIEVTLREPADPTEFERIAGVSEARASDGRLTLVVSGARLEPIRPDRRVLLGDVGARLTAGAHCSIIVAPRGFARREHLRFSRIGVGYDGTPESKTALEDAAEMARRFNASLELIGVAPRVLLTPSRLGGTDAGYERLLREEMEMRLEAAARVEGVDVGCTLRIGDAADELADASADLDLLVLGSRGYGPLRRVLLGGVSAKVMRAAPCPVMVIPRGSESSGRRGEPIETSTDTS